MKSNGLKITLLAFSMLFAISCQKEEKNNLSQTEKTTTSTLSFTVADEIKGYQDTYTLLNADSMIWGWRSVENGIFKHDFDCVWLEEEADDGSFINFLYDSIGNNLYLYYEDGTNTTLHDITDQGNETTFEVYYNNGTKINMKVNMPAEYDFIEALLATNLEAKDVSVSADIPPFIRYIKRILKKEIECIRNVAEKAAICSMHGCRPITTDRTVLCTGNDCSQYDYTCS